MFELGQDVALAAEAALESGVAEGAGNSPSSRSPRQTTPMPPRPISESTRRGNVAEHESGGVGGVQKSVGPRLEGEQGFDGAAEVGVGAGEAAAGVTSNAATATAVANAPALFAYSAGGKTYPAAVFLNGQSVGDPVSGGTAVSKAKPGDRSCCTARVSRRRRRGRS